MNERKINVKLLEQLKKALAWSGKSEDSFGKEIMVDKGVYKNAEKISKLLNTDVEGVFTLAAYRILKKRDLL
jgi:hypothetical protein